MSGVSTAENPISSPELPSVELHLHRPDDPAVGRVVASERCTASRKSASITRHLEIDVAGTRLAGRIRPGQSFGVIPPGEDDRGRPHRLRLYSAANPGRGEDGAGNVISTTVKRTIDERWDDHRLFLGVASNYLCDLQVGDEVRLTGPNGKRFLLPADPHAYEYLFFATGTGIAPFRGMLSDLLHSGFEGRVTLAMGSPYATDLLYDADLRRWQDEHENFTYLTALSRERQDGDDRPLYVQDRLETHGESLAELLGAERTLIYVCGVAGMELGIFQAMARLLPPEVLRQYLEVAPEAMEGREAWTRRMLHKQVKPTRRVFLEVYA